MANKKVSSFTMAVGDLDLGEETIRKLKRERELERTWELHHDELINLLEAHCKGECSMGNTKDNKFWMRVTRTMVLRLGLKLDADEETCESCMKYVESLHKMYTDYKCKKKAIEKIQRARPYLSPELISGLGRIFSEKISFKRASSVGKTSMTSRRSSSAKQRSNLSVNQPIIDENLIKDVEAAIFKLTAAQVIDLKDVKEVKSYLLSDELLCKVFMRYTDEERVDQIKKLLTKCNTHS